MLYCENVTFGRYTAIIILSYYTITFILCQWIEKAKNKIISVSYTHLDVYKRQAMSNSSSDESECRNENALTGEMAEIKEYIDKNYASIDSASDIAANFYYSREHLSRKFKSRFNISLADYITMRRINESVRLLGHMSVAEASYSVGFRSQS